jgi:uncharacterized protein YxeA
MKKIALLFILFISGLCTTAQTLTTNRFSFLLGNWELKTKTEKITEHWKSNSKMYTGSSYKHNAKGDSTLTETIIIKPINNVWYFCVTGYEKGNAGITNFKLVSTKNNIFIFENKAHDFPQRIVYQSKGKDRLFAWIEGKMDGKESKIDFLYQRKK